MNTRKKINYTIIFITAGLLLLPTMPAAQDISFTGMLRSYGAARFFEKDVPVTEQTADVSLEGWVDKTEFKINPYVYIGAEGEPGIGVREAYIDLFLPSADVRVGKQAIVWGKAEGAFITDIVSPQNLRSFILADFKEIRMGVPAVKGSYYSGPFTFKAVWLPRVVPTKQPEKGSIWYTEKMDKLSGAEQPDDSLENSEVFGKVSYFGSILNMELMAGYAWDDLPVLEGDINLSTKQDNTKALYERYTVAGGSFSTTIGSVVMRSEAAAYIDRAFTSIETEGPPVRTLETKEYNQFHGLAGIDWSIAGVDMSSQYIIKYINNYDDSLIKDEFDHTATLRLRDSYLANTLRWEIFAYAGFDPSDFSDLSGSADSLIRSSVTYKIEEGVEFKTGTEVFLGDEEGKFGRYNDNSLVYVSLRWYF